MECKSIDICDVCKIEYYKNTNTSKCEICNSNCLTCENGTVNDACVTCIKDEYISTKKKCVKKCEENEFIMDNKKCEICERSCLTCLNGKECLTCSKENFFNTNTKLC